MYCEWWLASIILLRFSQFPHLFAFLHFRFILVWRGAYVSELNCVKCRGYVFFPYTTPYTYMIGFWIPSNSLVSTIRIHYLRFEFWVKRNVSSTNRIFHGNAQFTIIYTNDLQWINKAVEINGTKNFYAEEMRKEQQIVAQNPIQLYGM